jgi:hypothetical protein
VALQQTHYENNLFRAMCRAAFKPLGFLDLVELAETAFWPLNVAASAFFKLGLATYQEEHPPKVQKFEFG